MGLLLSVLIVCVGFAEIVSFCRNVSREVVATSTASGDVATRHRKCVTIEAEDIELEFLDASPAGRYLLTEAEGTSRSGTATPRRFLVEHQEVAHPLVELTSRRFLVERRFTEKESTSKSSSSSHFLLEKHQEVPYLLAESETVSSSPSPRHFLVENMDVPHLMADYSSMASSSGGRLLVEGRDVSRQFTEEETTSRASSSGHLLVEDLFGDEKTTPRHFLVESMSRSSSSEELLVESEDVPHFVVERRDADHCAIRPARERSRSPIPLPKRFTVEDRSRSPSPFRRSSSPYPAALLLAVPRNSVCADLGEHPVAEVDEERCETPERYVDLLAASRHATCDYWTNKTMLTVPASAQRTARHRSTSPSPAAKHTHRRRSRSEVEVDENGTNRFAGLRFSTLARFWLC